MIKWIIGGLFAGPSPMDVVTHCLECYPCGQFCTLGVAEGGERSSSISNLIKVGLKVLFCLIKQYLRHLPSLKSVGVPLVV